MGDLPVLADLVELVPDPERRFRECFVDDDDDEYFPDEDGYREWRLRTGADQLLELLGRSPDTGDLLMNFLLNDAVESQVVWFSPNSALVCEGPDTNDLDYAAAEYHTKLFIYDSDSRRYRVFLITYGGGLSFEPRVLHALHVVVALGTRVAKVVMNLWDQEMYEGVVPGIREYVSLARSRRTLEFYCDISPETGRELAFHCNPVVELKAQITRWEDKGAALAEAMVANQCPARLSLSYWCDVHIVSLAPALAATTAVEELRIELPVVEDENLNAIRRNGSVRVLIATQHKVLKQRDAEAFWRAAFANGTVERIDVSGVADGVLSHSTRKRESSELIGTLLRSNPRITSIKYVPRIYDEQVMESRVVPILHFNKFRPVVEALFNGSTDRAGRERAVSALLGSPLVRRHPELLYFLLKVNRENLLAVSDGARVRPASTRRQRKRARR
jgi:hypothetical protein